MKALRKLVRKQKDKLVTWFEKKYGYMRKAEHHALISSMRRSHAGEMSEQLLSMAHVADKWCEVQLKRRMDMAGYTIAVPLDGHFLYLLSHNWDERDRRMIAEMVAMEVRRHIMTNRFWKLGV